MISIDTIWLAIEPMDMRADAGCRGVRCDEAALCLSVRQPPRQSYNSVGA